MACKRIIACLDVMNGRTVKGTRFTNLKDLGDPAAMALYYQEQGADEITLLDITASPENRATRTEWVRNTAKKALHTPHRRRRRKNPGRRGGDTRRRRRQGNGEHTGGEEPRPDNTDSEQVRQPVLHPGHRHQGKQQQRKHGAHQRRQDRHEDRTDQLDKNGTERRSGRDTPHQLEPRRHEEGLSHRPNEKGCRSNHPAPDRKRRCRVPGHFTEVFTKTKATAALAAGILHRGEYTIRQIKETLKQEGIEVRPC